MSPPIVLSPVREELEGAIVSVSYANLGQSGLPAEIFGHWVHSWEEDAGGVEMYRSKGFDFPPSFGRDGFIIAEDGTFVQEDPGPADGVVQVPGRWVQLASRRLAVSFAGSTARPGFSFDVVSVQETVLRIRRLARRPESTGQHTQPAPDQAQLQAFYDLPAASSGRLVDFDYAQVITLRSLPPQHILRVSGVKPYLNMTVRLVPLVYVSQPGYWEIEVVGSLPGVGLPALVPYEVSLPVTATMGTRGIEVVGATRRERIDVPGLPQLGGTDTRWSAFIDRQPPGPSTLHVVGRPQFPTAGYTVTLRPHTPQGINPRDLLLDKIVEPPSGPAAQVITEAEVRYDERTETGYDTVTILPDGITIPVEEAH